MSFAALLLELGLTRLFSVVLFYHFAFLAISIALLGLGAGAVFACLRHQWLSRWSINQLGSVLCAANAIVILAVLELVVHTAVSLHLNWPNFWRLTALYLASAVPFFITGLLFSVVFARQPARITQLYGADLLGGSLACLALVPLLNFIGAPNAILFAAVVVALAAVAWAAPGKRARIACGVSAAALLLLIAANFHGQLIDIVYAKGMKRAVPLYARWNAISRVEVDKQGTGRAIVIDADAQTSLMNTDPHHWSDAYRRNLMSAAPSVANVLRPHGDFAIIGPGGGVDVLRAVANGSTERHRHRDQSHHRQRHHARPLRRLRLSPLPDSRGAPARQRRPLVRAQQPRSVRRGADDAGGHLGLDCGGRFRAQREQPVHRRSLSRVLRASEAGWHDRHHPLGVCQPREALRVVSQAMEALA